MYPRGHAGISLIVSAPLTVYFKEVPEFTIFVIIMMWTSILPDLDIPVCRRFSAIRHRGISHTVWSVIFCSAVSIVAYKVAEPWLFFSQEVVLIGVSLGMLSHIIGDGLNKDGVNPFMLANTDGYHLQMADISSDSYYFNNLSILVGVSIIFLVVLLKII